MARVREKLRTEPVEDLRLDLENGYGERPDSQPLALTETRPYAWRVITVSRDGLRYAAGPWSSFTLGRDAR